MLAVGFVMTSFFNLRVPSLLRGNILTLGSLLVSFPLAKFPYGEPNLAMVLPILAAIAGTADAFRCIQVRWSLYHGTVVLSLYMDTLILTMILFLALYPLFTQ